MRLEWHDLGAEIGQHLCRDCRSHTKTQIHDSQAGERLARASVPCSTEVAMAGQVVSAIQLIRDQAAKSADVR